MVMNIERSEMMEALLDFISEGHGCVVGAPGAGKSHSLKRIATRIIDNGGTCLYLPVDKIPARNQVELKSRLSLDEDSLIDFLAAQPKQDSQRSVLIIDALDAARSEETRTFYASLVSEVIQTLGDTWRVICSVRAFDAKRMNELLKTLPPASRTKNSNSFADVMPDVRCRHFNIPALTENDVLEAAATIPGLETLYQQGSQDLKRLLLSPFNLWILSRLVEGGRDLSDVSFVRTETELLDFYWGYRLAECVNEEAAKMILSAAALEMVEGHSLSCVRGDLVAAGHGPAMTDVLRTGLLEDMTRTGHRVVFAHNILFDFAVSVLLIDETLEGFRTFITAEPSRALFLRPSIEFYIERLWNEQRTIFWQIFWDLLKPKEGSLRLVGRLLPPAILLRNTITTEDLAPIHAECERDLARGELAIQRVFQALHTLDVPSGREELWSEWCCRISDSPSVGLLFYLTRSLEVLLEAALKRDSTYQAGQYIGEASRKLLHWVLAERDRTQDTRLDRIGAIGLVPLVCKTVRTDIEGSVRLLSQVLDLLQIESFPIEYISRLCYNINPLIEHAPDFASHIYNVVFGKNETSNDRTVMREGVMSLTSTRRQDFRMCQYTLKDSFAEFLTLHPEEAVETAVLAGTAGVLIDHHYRSREDGDLSEYQHSFELFGHKWTILEDGCHIWGQSDHPEDAAEIGNALFAWIREGLETDRKERFEIFMRSLQKHFAGTFFWRQVFMLAEEFPDLLVETVWPFATISHFLHLMDVRYEVGSFLAEASSRLSPDRLHIIEQTILKLPNLATEDKDTRYFSYARDCMLKAIGRENLSAEGLAYLNARDKNERVEIPPPHTFKATHMGYSEKAALREQGIDDNTPGYAECTSINERMREFCGKWQNGRPNAEAVQEGLPLAREAWGLYNSDLVKQDILKNRLIVQCADCCERLSKGVESAADEAYGLCRVVLLYCADHTLPKPYDDMEQQFTYPSWSPAPRNEAAQGLTWLARFKTADDEDLIQAIERLSADPVPSVRYLLAENLFRLAREHEETFWRLIGTRAKTEKNTTVLFGIADSLRQVIRKDTDKACMLLDHLVPAALADAERDNLMERVLGLAMGTYLHYDHEWGSSVLNQVTEDPGRKPKAMNRILLDAVGYITPAFLDDADGIKLAEKARNWLLAIIPSVTQCVASFLDEGESEKATELYHGLDTIVSQLYFPLMESRDGGRLPQTTTEQKNAFFTFIRPLLECVLDSCSGEKSLGLHAHTAHHFVQMLNLVLPFDPPYVLHMARQVIDLSQAGGYQHDSLAIGEVVKLVESVLANHREEVRGGQPLDDMITILDIFCDAGSTKALNLVWRLDEVFR